MSDSVSEIIKKNYSEFKVNSLLDKLIKENYLIEIDGEKYSKMLYVLNFAILKHNQNLKNRSEEDLEPLHIFLEKVLSIYGVLR
jgi:hypothetical protein